MKDSRRFVSLRVVSWTASSSSGGRDRRERVEQFGLLVFRDGAQVYDDASVEYARDDGRRGAAQSVVERGGRERRVRERDERGRRVRGRRGAAADCGLAFDDFKSECAAAEARANPLAEGADAALNLVARGGEHAQRWHFARGLAAPVRVERRFERGERELVRAQRAVERVSAQT